MVNSGSFDSDGYRNGKARCTQASDAATVSQSSEIGDAADATCKNDGSKSADTDLPSDASAIEPTPSKTEINSSMPTEASSNDDKASLCCSLPLEKIQDPLTSCSSSPDNSVAEDKPKRTRKLLCLFCDRSFVSANLRQKHVERVHTHTVKPTRRVSARRQNQLSVTTCVHCDKLNASGHTINDLFQHLVREHPTKYFGCLSCEERFLTSTHLVDHNSSQHGTEENTNINRQSPTALQIEEVDVDGLQDTGEAPLVKVTRSKLRNKSDDPLELEADSNLQTRKKKSKLKELRSKKISVKTSKIALKRSKRLQAQTKESDSQKKRREKKLVTANKSEASNSTKQPEKPKPICVNPFPEFDNFYRVKKITDHSIDNLKISSLTFDDVFDKAFFNRIKCNIEENLLHHIDGKLFKNEESESRISNFEKISTNPQEIQTSTSENYGCELSLNAITPVPSLSLNSQFGEDFESQIEYGSKPSKKKTQTKSDEVHYKYFTRRKYQASILQQKENRDLSKLDMWTQMVVKERQEKVLNKNKNAKEIQEYTAGAEYKNKMKKEELNRILDRRGPFEDLKEEASKKAAFDKLNSSSDNDISQEVFSDVRAVLNDILNKVFDAVKEDDCPPEVASKEIDHREIPAYLDLRRQDSSTQEEIDKSDRIALICSSQETENYELPTNTVRGKNEIIELTGEWARSRMYICAACGGKFSNMKYLLEHRSIYHQNVWVQNYEFVGNQSELYRHLSIPGLGKVGVVEDIVPCKQWKRSDARMCTKCGKQCNSLGELHRHVLECGGDWTWMLARKKCKYRPFGAKSRRKRRGLGPRIHNKRKTESSEKKNYKKPLEGPRQRPSDADTIQRMLANLPAKRSRRSLISLRDVVFKSRKTNQRNNTQAATVKCGKTVCKKQKTEISNSNISQQRSSRSLRSLNKVLSSRILDINSSLIVKRKLKVMRGQRSTKTLHSKSNIRKTDAKEIEADANSINSIILPAQKRKSPKKCTNSSEISKNLIGISLGENKTTLAKKILTNRLNIKNFFPIKKKNVTSGKKNSILDKNSESETDIEPTRQSIYLENSQNMEKNRRGGLKGLVRALSLRKRNSKYEEPTEKIVSKNLETADMVESNSIVTKKVGRPKSKNSSSSDNVSHKTDPSTEHNNLDKDLSKKRKLQRGFRNVINKVKKIKTEITAHKSDEKIKTEKTSHKSSDEETLKKSSKEIELQPFLEEESLPTAMIPPEKVVSSAEVEENIQEKEDHAPIVADLLNQIKKLPIPEIVIHVTDNKEKSLPINDDLTCENQEPNLTPGHQESICAAIKDVVSTINDPPILLLDLGHNVTPVTIDTNIKPKCVPLVSPNIKGKIRKPNRGLNDCIAMLTSKLHQKDEKTSSSLESLFSTSSTTSMERTESRQLMENISPPVRQQKNECILKIPTFRATKSPVVEEEMALDLSKKYFSSPDLTFSHSSDAGYIESTINKVIEGVIEHKCKEVLTEKFAAPKWTSVDDIIQQVVQSSSSTMFGKPSNKKNIFMMRNNVDDTIDYVVNSSIDWFEIKNSTSEEKRKRFKKLRKRKKSDDHLIKDIIFGKDKLIIAPSSSLHNALESSLIAKIKENESKMNKTLTMPNDVLEKIDRDLEKTIKDGPVSNIQEGIVETHPEPKENLSNQEADKSNQSTPVINEPTYIANDPILLVRDKEEIEGQNEKFTQDKNTKDGTANIVGEQFNLINLLNEESKNVNEPLVAKNSENDLFSKNNILQPEAPKKDKAKTRRKVKKAQMQENPDLKTKPVIETCIDDCLNIIVVSDVESQPSTSNFVTENSNLDIGKNKQMQLISGYEPIILENKIIEPVSKSLPSDSEDEIPLAVFAKQEEMDPLKRNLCQNGNVLHISKNVLESLDSKQIQDQDKDRTKSLVIGTYTQNLLEEVTVDKQNNDVSSVCDPSNLNKEIVENSITDSLKENIEQAVSKNASRHNYIFKPKTKSLKRHQIIRPIKRKRRKTTFGNKRHTKKRTSQTNLNILIKTVENKNISSDHVPLCITPVPLDTRKINILEASKLELPDEDQSDLPKEAAVCNEPVSPSDLSNELVKSQPRSTKINEPGKILIHSQKTRRKSKSSKKIDKFDNDLFKDFSLVINKKTKRIPPTNIVDDSVCDDVLDKNINLLEKCSEIGIMNTSEEASEPLIDSVEEMDMEIEDIPINASIIERDNQQNITIKSFEEYNVTIDTNVNIQRSHTPDNEIQTTNTRKSPRKNSLSELTKTTISAEQIDENNTDLSDLNVELNNRGSRKGRKNKIGNSEIEFLTKTCFPVDTSQKLLQEETETVSKVIPVHELPFVDVLQLGSSLEAKDTIVVSENADDTEKSKFSNAPTENICTPINLNEKVILPVNNTEDFTTDNILEEKNTFAGNLKQTEDLLENTETCEDRKLNKTVNPIQPLETSKGIKKQANKNTVTENQSQVLANLSSKSDKKGANKANTEKLSHHCLVNSSLEKSDNPKTLIVLENSVEQSSSKKSGLKKSRNNKKTLKKDAELSALDIEGIMGQHDSLVSENTSEALMQRKRSPRKPKLNTKYTEESNKADVEPEDSYGNKLESNDLSSSIQTRRTRKIKYNQETAEINTCLNVQCESSSDRIILKNNKTALKTSDINSEFIDVHETSTEDSLSKNRKLENPCGSSKNNKSCIAISTHQSVSVVKDKSSSEILNIENSIEPADKTLKSKNSPKNIKASLNSRDDNTQLDKPVDSEPVFPNGQSFFKDNDTLKSNTNPTHDIEKLSENSRTEEMNNKIAVEKFDKSSSEKAGIESSDKHTRESKSRSQETTFQRRSPRKTKNYEKNEEDMVQSKQSTSSYSGNTALCKMVDKEHLNKPILEGNDICTRSTEIFQNTNISLSKKGNTKKLKNSEVTTHQTEDACLLEMLKKNALTKDILEENRFIESPNIYKSIKESTFNKKSRKFKNSKKESKEILFEQVVDIKSDILDSKNISENSWKELEPKEWESTSRNKTFSSTVDIAAVEMNDINIVDNSNKHLNIIDIQGQSSHKNFKEFIETITTDSIKVVPGIQNNIEDSFLERSSEESPNNDEINKAFKSNLKKLTLPDDIFDSTGHQVDVNLCNNRSKTPINNKNIVECETVTIHNTNEPKTLPKLENKSLTAKNQDVIDAPSKPKQLENVCEIVSLSKRTKRNFRKNRKHSNIKLCTDTIEGETTQESLIKTKNDVTSKKQQEGLSENMCDMEFNIDDEISIAERVKMSLNQPPERNTSQLSSTNNEHDPSISEQVSDDRSMLNRRRSNRNRSAPKPYDEITTIDRSLVSKETHSNCTPKELLEFINMDLSKTPELNSSESTGSVKYQTDINQEIGKSRRSRKKINYNEENLEEKSTSFKEMQEIKEPTKLNIDQNPTKCNKRIQSKLDEDTPNSDKSVNVSRNADFSEMPELVVDLELIDREYVLIKSLTCSKENINSSVENYIDSNKNNSDINELKETCKESDSTKQVNTISISEAAFLQETTKLEESNEMTRHGKSISKREKRARRNIHSDELDADALDTLDTIDNQTTKCLNIFDFEESASTSQDIIEYKKRTPRSAKNVSEISKQLETEKSSVTEISEIDKTQKVSLGRRSRKNVNYNDEKWEPFVDGAKQENLMSIEDLNTLNLEQIYSIENDNKKHGTLKKQKLPNSKEHLDDVKSVKISAAEILSHTEAINTEAPIRTIRNTKKLVDFEKNLLATKTVTDSGLPKDLFDVNFDASLFNENPSEEKSKKVETAKTLIISGDELLNIDDLSGGNILQTSKVVKNSRKTQIKKSTIQKKSTALMKKSCDTVESSLVLLEAIKTLNTFDFEDAVSNANLIKSNKTNDNTDYTANSIIPNSDSTVVTTENIQENERNNTFKTSEKSDKETPGTFNFAQDNENAHTVGASELPDVSKISKETSKFKKQRKNIMDIDIANILDIDEGSENRRSSRKKRSVNYEKLKEPVEDNLNQTQSHIDELLKSQLSEDKSFSWDTDSKVITANLENNKTDLTELNVVKDDYKNEDQLQDSTTLYQKELEPDDSSLDSYESVPLLDRMTHLLKNIKNKPDATNNSSTDAVLQISNSFTEYVPDNISNLNDSVPIISVNNSDEAVKNTEKAVSHNQFVDKSIRGNLDALLPLVRSSSMESLLLERKQKVTKVVKSKGRKRKSNKKKFDACQVPETKDPYGQVILAESKLVNPKNVSKTEETFSKPSDQERQLAKINIKDLLLSSLAPPKSNDLSLVTKNFQPNTEGAVFNNLKESDNAEDEDSITVQNSNTAFEKNTPKLKSKKLKRRKSKSVALTQSVTQIFDKALRKNSGLNKTKNDYALSNNLNFTALKNVLSTIAKPGKRNKRKKSEGMFSEIKPLTDIITSSEIDIAPVLDEIDKSLESEDIYDFNEEEISIGIISSKNNNTNKNRLRSRSCPKPDISNTNLSPNIETSDDLVQTENEPTRINSKRSAKAKALENIHEKANFDLNCYLPEPVEGAQPRKSRRRSKSLNGPNGDTENLITDNESKNSNTKMDITSTLTINNSFSIQDEFSDNTSASKLQTDLLQEPESSKMEDNSYAKALENPINRHKTVECALKETNDFSVCNLETNETPQNVNQNNNLHEFVEPENEINSLTDCQELRRSRRGSRKVASYNENDLIDPLIDALENRRNRSKKDKSAERHSSQKDTPKDLPTEKPKLNSEELFDLLKNSSYENENLNILKPRNSFLENLNEPNSNTDFQDITDEEFDDVLEKPSLILTGPEKIKDIDKIYEFNEDSPENTEQVKEFGINKRKLTTNQEGAASGDLKINSVCNNSVENSLSSYASKERDIEQEKSNYCEICKKTFIRLENLIKHKTTLTHISKLSELEAKEAEERTRLESEKQSEEKSSNLLLKTSDSLRDEINIRDILQRSERTPVASSPKNSSSLSNQPLNLVDIISDVLNKPVLENFNSEKHGYAELAIQNTNKRDIRRYKSLGERKSFESESQLSRISTPLSESYLPSAMSKTTILENQIHLLENIIGNKLESLAANEVQTENNFIDEVSSCSNNSNISATDNNSCASNRSGFNPNSENNQVNLHSGFIKPSHYEEISEDSSNARVCEDLKLRKTLNRDEELFLECCSLLKSGSEVSNSTYSKNVKKPLDHVKETDEPELLENKKLTQTVEEAHEYSDNSRTPTPLGDTYDDEASNSNTISSNWNLKSERPLDKNRSFSFEEVVNKEVTGISFGEILTKGLRNQFEYMPKLDERTEEGFQNTQPSEIFVIEDRKDDSDCSSTSKKISTKGARKVFEGLKVSIPTEDLNLDLFNNSLVNKKPELHQSRSEDTSPSIENQAAIHNKPRSTRKSKPVKKSQVGSNLLFKVNKKKASTQSNSTDLPKKPDIYNFEETQDNTDIFTKPLLIKDLKIAKLENKDKIVALDSDIESLGYADSIGADAKSVSSVSSISAMSTKKPEVAPENITKKKYKIMGKIFRNAAKPKSDEIDEELRNIPEIPEIDNLELVQNYVRSCQRIKSPFLPPPPPPPLNDVPKKPKMTEEEMNLLFDQLLGKEINEPTFEKPVCKLSLAKSRAESKTGDIKKKVNKVKNRKRARINSESSDDEFNINKTAKKRTSKKYNQEDSGINLELELKECIGVASRKSQRKCTSGKQNILVEYWSSDEEAFEAMLNSQKIQPKTDEGNKKSEQRECTTEELSKEEPLSEIPSLPAEKLIKSKPVKRKSQSFKKSKTLSNKNPDSGGMASTASNRRKRAAANPLYHWSSSSEDESQSLIEVKPIREEDDEEDRPIQHGWIVGDSPKKLVTMLALTKGKKTDIDSVKEQGKRRTSNTVS